ncbi:hypothetical protein Golomagni_07104 [Golovinomyces magnicellulatus]|nr:hypothetical protein Golomagni_07104 [Golovinomyces magnicellulatus]
MANKPPVWADEAAPDTAFGHDTSSTTSVDETHFVSTREETSLKRGLEQRHLSMLGVAGAIGTGLFLGLGGAVQTGGPLGALLGYATVGLVYSLRWERCARCYR